MNTILNYLVSSPVLVIVLALGVIYVFSRLLASSKGHNTKSEHLVPEYVRFERREGLIGERRQMDHAPGSFLPERRRSDRRVHP